MNELEFIRKCRDDIIYFAEHMLRSEDGGFYKLEEHQKVMVSSKQSQVVYFCGRRLGKSFMLAIEAIHRALFNRYQKIFVLSPTESQAKELGETISGLIERSAVIEQEVKVDNRYEKKFYNGSRIVIKTAGGRGNVSSIIGSGTNLLILDEIQDIPEELIYKIIPVMRGQTGDSKMITAGTPRAKAGFLYESLENAPYIWNNGEEIYDEEKTGTFYVYRKQTAYLDENDNIIKSGTPRITIDELQEDMSNMPIVEFKQEYCLNFMSSISDVYSEELRESFFYQPRQNISWGTNAPVVFGLDVGKMRNESVLTIAEVIPFPLEDNKSYKKLDVKWYKEFPLGTEYDTIEKYIAYELPTSFPNIVRGVIDATGVGEPVFEAIEKKVIKAGKPFPVEPYKFTKEKKKDIVEGGVAYLERGQVKVAYHKRLDTEMGGYKREVTEFNNTIYKKTSGSDDYVDSFNLCLYNIALGIQVSPPMAMTGVPKTLKKEVGDRKCRQPLKRPPLTKSILTSLRRRF